MADTDDELTAAMAYLYGRLADDVALTAVVAGRVFDDGPPADTAYPYVTIGVQAAPDVQATDGTIILTDVIARLVVVTDAPTYPGTTARLAHEAIHRTNDYAAGGRVHACRRIQALRYSERENDRHYRYQGGLYRLTLGPAT